MRFIHTADVHLDGEPARLAGFAAVVDAAITHDVDLLIVAGDLFDHARVMQVTVDEAIEELRRVPCDVIVVPGNHDCMDERSLYHRVDLTVAGPQVHFFGEPEGRWHTIDALKLAIWGRGITEHLPTFHPLETYRHAHDEYWRLAVTHGFYVPPEETTTRSSPITSGEIGALTCDYLALGHWHGFLDVSAGDVHAYYSGSPSIGNVDIHVLEDPSVNLVTLDPERGVVVERVPIALAEAPDPQLAAAQRLTAISRD
ncbi:MAG: metallophosphoesterase [Actinobacteria bacterium]|nr:metallophosphoesterase [Actinomycetota bacterium]